MGRRVSDVPTMSCQNSNPWAAKLAIAGWVIQGFEPSLAILERTTGRGPGAKASQSAR